MGIRGANVYNNFSDYSSFELLVGLPPFYLKNGNQNPELIFKNIKDKEIAFPSAVKMSENVKDLISRVIVILIKLSSCFRRNCIYVWDTKMMQMKSCHTLGSQL